MAVSEGVVSALLIGAVVVTLFLSFAALKRVDPAVDELFDVLRGRLIYGVPWGTLVTVGIVLGIYLFVQGGWTDWENPVTIPFRAWSYFYPTGMVLGGLSHNSSSHLIGNLTGTIVLGPLAEHVWGHYPNKRSGDEWDHSFATFPFSDNLGAEDDPTSYLEVPWIRAVVIFPLALVLVAIVTTFFALGPVIGFSGAVFALGGFALVRYPLTTVVLLTARRAVSTVYSALTDPVVIAGTSPSPPSPPSWATIAVQGHALGILTGIVLGLALLRYRNQKPPAARLWLATFVYGIVQGLWAVYWFLGDGEYVLYRGAGVVLVALLAVLVVGAAAGPTDRWFPNRGGETTQSLSWRFVGTVLLMLGLVLLAGPSIIPNLAQPGGDAVPNEQSIEIQDYEITYAENARNQMIPRIDLPYLDEQTNVTTSGVIVVSEERGIWTQSTSRQRLAFSGSATTQVGGIGWREEVTAERSGWNIVGNNTAYTVSLAGGGEQIHAFNSEPQTAEPTVANRSVTVDASRDGFELSVAVDGDPLNQAPVPEANESVTLGGVQIHNEFVEDDDRSELFVERNGTRVRIAVEETYN